MKQKWELETKIMIKMELTILRKMRKESKEAQVKENMACNE